jgi:hypothetical protein
MKPIKLIIAATLISGVANAATVTVSAGLPAQGITPLLNGTALASYYVSVGSWNSATETFTSFGSVTTDAPEVNGSFTATGPSSFNGQEIYLYVGTSNVISTSGVVAGTATPENAWVVFRNTSAPKFLADVSQAGSTTFNATTTTVVQVVKTNGVNYLSGTGNPTTATGWTSGGTNTNNFNLVVVPEPSAALLGAIGALGLLRRRRN